MDLETIKKLSNYKTLLLLFTMNGCNPCILSKSIIDNNNGRLVGDIWLYALHENFEVEKETMLLMR